ncbi:MAG: hypothetical protein PQJ60_04630, partial [Spirochaetales bacterium]|nr:hypothetical protein [Spirochaetales bacterium]
EIIDENPGGCYEWEGTEHFHFDLYGNFIPPGCVGLQIDHKDLGKELNRENYPHLALLKDRGVGALYEKARSQGYTPREEGYVSRCDLCGSVRRFIIEQDSPAEGKDLGPAEYYTAD